jgi:hypothetical protein
MAPEALQGEHLEREERYQEPCDQLQKEKLVHPEKRVRVELWRVRRCRAKEWRQ